MGTVGFYADGSVQPSKRAPARAIASVAKASPNARPHDPAGRAGLWPDGRRKLFGGGFDSPKEDGGRDEFR
jgi:hypothetical protein